MRHFDNWLSAYYEYARDGFVPDKFHFWTGVSVLAASLERKVWLPWNSSYTVFPNIYILLVAKPAIGKSTAINRGVELLLEMRQMGAGYIKTVPSQVTEAKLIELMSTPDYHEYHDKQIPHSSAYMFISEASQCFKDITGSTGLVPTITQFYDCDRLFEKATVSMKGQTQRIINLCFNLLSGSTFDYLDRLITNEESLKGGLASRFIYVVQSDFWERKVTFQDRGKVESDKGDYKLKLIEDLGKINKMVGPFYANEEFADVWESWYQEHDKKLQNHPSPSMQSLLARKHTMMSKLPMILSAAQSDKRVLELAHFEEALRLIEDTEKVMPQMIQEGKSQSTGTQSGINSAIFLTLAKCSDKKINRNRLVSKLVMKGFNKDMADKTISALALTGGPLEEEGTQVVLAGDFENYI